jgi:serine/threonine-protein kinase
MDGGLTLACGQCGVRYFQESVAHDELRGTEWVCPDCRERADAGEAAGGLFPAAEQDEAVVRERLERATGGRYEVGALLGRGLGLVFKGRRRGSEGRVEWVAIKTIHPRMAEDVRAAKRFLREADLARQLGDHHHLVEFQEGGYGEGLYYLVMELVEGPTLLQHLRRSDRLHVPEAGRLVVQALDGLAHAHRAVIETEVTGAEGVGQRVRFRGLVHRDLKPENLLLAGGKTLKVADLGLAKAFDAGGNTNVTGEDEVAGTPYYWPREQIESFRYLDPRSDVFSMGAILYTLLTGVYPRPGMRTLPPGSPRLVSAVLRDSVEPIEKTGADVPDTVRAVVRRALSERAADRFADAGVMRDALREALVAAGVTMKPCGCA